jgi:putative phage-type endonuclease
MRYGLDTESAARKSYQMLTNNKAFEVGLIIKANQPWLSCSPDGLFLDSSGNLAVIEIKCPSSCKDDQIKVDYIDANEKLIPSHSYYTQVQIQMYVTGAKMCHFYVYSGSDHKLLYVNYDESFL